MDTTSDTSVSPADPLALVVTLVELAGLAVSTWCIYRLLRQDPDFETWRLKVKARLTEMREQRRFARVSTVVPEAAFILSEVQP